MIASRLAAVYFFAWAVSDLIYLLKDVYTVHFFIGWAAHTGSTYDAYLRSDEVQMLCSRVIHITLALLVAGWAYRCGPGVTRFFFPETEPPAER